MTNSIKLSKANKSIKALVESCYPEYKGRKIRAHAATEYQMSNYWSEGSRNYVVAYHIESGKIAEDFAAGNPFREDRKSVV